MVPVFGWEEFPVESFKSTPVLRKSYPAAWNAFPFSEFFQSWEELFWQGRGACPRARGNPCRICILLPTAYLALCSPGASFFRRLVPLWRCRHHQCESLDHNVCERWSLGAFAHTCASYGLSAYQFVGLQIYIWAEGILWFGTWMDQKLCPVVSESSPTAEAKILVVQPWSWEQPV